MGRLMVYFSVGSNSSGKLDELKILIVEDDEHLRLNLIRYLSNQGYKVTGASSGQQAIDLIRRDEYALMLTDIKLPDIDGIEILKYLQHIDARTECIVMTAYANLNTVLDAFHSGATDYLEKPFPLKVLERKIAKLNLFTS